MDIPAILAKLGFMEQLSATDGAAKYVHPDLELELLVPMVGRETKAPLAIPKPKTNAQRLRFLDLLESNTIEVGLKSLKAIVPEPAAYTYQKILIQDRR